MSGSSRGSPTSPDKVGASKRNNVSRSPPLKGNQQDGSLAVMGHSMITRSGDPDSDLTGLNLDLRLITGRMAQTLNTYEGRAAILAKEQIKDVENQLDEIANPILKVKIKGVLEDYKSLATEREEILYTLGKWFENCADEFLEELEDFESQQDEEGDSLSDHIGQAKDIIAKIKYINCKIVEFQSNGMSTEKLIAQKKELESELLKKKVIVDNTQTDTEMLAMFTQQVDGLLLMIKDSTADEIEKALLDLKLTEASDYIKTQIIELERTSRRVGVLFKNVKELENTNGQLADENSFLKQRLAKVDNQFKVHLIKKVEKLDNALDELGDVKYIKSRGLGSNSHDIDRRVGGGGGMSMEMEMIENYQQQIQTLDIENKDLIIKVETLEEENDDFKEEIKTLEQKLIKSISDHDKIRKSTIAVEHPLVKLDKGNQQDTISLDSISSATNFSEGNIALPMSQPAESKRKTVLMNEKNQREAMVSTITIQDGKKLEALRVDNDLLRGQISKLKTALSTARKQAVKPKRHTKNTQTKILKPGTDDVVVTPEQEEEDEIEEEEEKYEEEEGQPEEESAEETTEEVRSQSRATRLPKKQNKYKESIQFGHEDACPPPFSSASSIISSEVKDDRESPFTKTEIKKCKQDRANSDLQSDVGEKDGERGRSRRMKAREDAEDNRQRGDKSDPEHSDLTDSSSESEEEAEEQRTPQTPTKSIVKKNKKKIAPKQHVKFEEPDDMKSSEPETPTFERVPTPKVETEDAVITLEKIKEEMKDFLSYGRKFITSIHQCLSDTADSELALNIYSYSELERKIMGLETSLNILLYGIDLGMHLVTPNQMKPTHSPLPFENKLYFQENLSKYLREKYPNLNVSSMKLFDPELEPVKQLHPAEAPSHAPSPSLKSYTDSTSQQPGNFSNFTIPLTATHAPEPKSRQRPKKIHKRKPMKREETAGFGKIEEIMVNLTSDAVFGRKNNRSEAKKLLDDRTFNEIVDHVMPKEIAMEYLKLIQPTHDTIGKKQYIEKVKRGILKVKDLLDLLNLNSNQGVIKGMPSNKLGEPRARQTKIHHTNLDVSDLIGQSNMLAPAQSDIAEIENSYIYRYKQRLAHYDERERERVRASLDEYTFHHHDDLRVSNSLTVMEVPLTPRTLHDWNRGGKYGEFRGYFNRIGTKEENLFDLSKSNPNMDQLLTPEKRTFLPVVTQNLLPHSEAKKFPTRNMTKKLRKSINHQPVVDQNHPKISDLLKLEWETPKLSSVAKLPKIANASGVTEQQSFITEQQSFP